MTEYRRHRDRSKRKRSEEWEPRKSKVKDFMAATGVSYAHARRLLIEEHNKETQQ